MLCILQIRKADSIPAGTRIKIMTNKRKKKLKVFSERMGNRQYVSTYIPSNRKNTYEGDNDKHEQGKQKRETKLTETVFYRRCCRKSLPIKK